MRDKIDIERGAGDGDITFNNSKNTTKVINKNRNIVTISISIAIIIAIGCAIYYFLSSNSPEKLIVGRWQTDGENYLEFTENGILTSNKGTDGAVFTYHVQDDDRIQIDVQILWGHGTIMADMDVTKTTLTLSNFSDPDDIWGFDENTELTLTRMK